VLKRVSQQDELENMDEFDSVLAWCRGKS
jgi:hypothetical protein